MRRLLATLCLACLLACGASSGAAGGGTTGGGGSGTSAASGGSGGGSSGGGSGGVVTDAGPTSCAIDGGTFQANEPNPGNPCEICSPGANATAWTPNVVSTHCAGSDGGAGICDLTGHCCTVQCTGNNNCTDGSGMCASAADCCGIPQ